MLALLVPLLLAAATPAHEPHGAALYATYCASCHGADASGTADGPSLHGVGLASVDFYLTTGRMPAAVPWLEIGDRDEREGQRLAPADIHAIEAYLAPIVAGGPPIPAVIAGSNVEHGRALYALNCEHCHSANGDGGAIGGLDWAPDLHHASITVIADAVRAGPEEMPRFGERQLSGDDLNDLAAYVIGLQKAAPPRGVPPFRSSGPVPEGAIGYLAIIVLVAFVFTYWRESTPPREREEAVRRDEPERT
jgi:ubiquinol-cytochrome c reductase cytochrome c subunit